MRTILIFLAALTTSCAALKPSAAAPNANSTQRHQIFSLSSLTSKWYGETKNKLSSKIGHVPARQTTTPPEKTLNVRVTTYWKGQDKWTSRGMSATGQRLISGKSAAVDFRLIKPNSKLSFLSNGVQKEFVATDTGSAIRSRRASRKTGRNEPVIDIFFNTRAQAMSFLNTLPKNQIVQIQINKNSTKDAKVKRS